MLRRFRNGQDFRAYENLNTSSSDSESTTTTTSEYSGESEEEEVDDDNDQVMDTDEEADVVDATKKPYRFFVFDIECSQDEETRPEQFKHRPILICAEMICTECISAGVKIGGANDNNINIPRPVGCVCKGTERMLRRLRAFVVPETDGRCFRFNNFEDANKNPIDDMLDFLTKRAPENAITIALSHNGLIG